MVKAQVLTGGRGKAGGVKFCTTADAVEEKARNILALDIKGFPVRKVLMTSAANILNEIYFGIVTDRSTRRAVVMFSAAGGMNIEEARHAVPLTYPLLAIYKMQRIRHIRHDDTIHVLQRQFKGDGCI